MPRFFLFTVTFLFTFLYNIVQAQKGEPTLIEQQYNVKLISPKQLSPFSTIQNVVQDSLGFIWISTGEGLHCLDGKDITTYNASTKSGKIDVVKEGEGYFRMALGTNNILWVTENISGDIIGFDVLNRKEIARIHVAEYYSDGNLQTLNNGKTFLLYTDKENTTYLTCVSCPDRNKKKLFHGKAVKNYKSFRNEHWVHGDSTFFQFSSDGDLLKSYTDHKYHFLNWKYGDSLTFYDPLKTIPLVFNPTEKIISPSFVVPEIFNTGGFRHVKRKDEVWLSDLHHKFFIWNKKENTAQDYSSTISNLLKDKAPAGLTSEYRFGLEMQNGSVIYSRFNTLILFTEKKEDSEIFEEHLTTEQQIASMRGLAEDENENIYASYYTAVEVKKKGEERFREFRDTKDAGKEAERTYSLSSRNNKLLWNMAVFDLEMNSRTHFEQEEYGQHVNHCLEKDTIWAYEWYTNKFMKYVIPTAEYELISENLIENTPVVSDIEIEKEKGYLWFATQYYGIMVFNKSGDLLHNYQPDFLGLQANKSNVFFIELEGDSVWFGSERGLGLINRKTQEVRIFDNPVSNSAGVELHRKMFSVLEDKDENFYLGTDYGICYFEKKKLQFQNLIPKHPLANIEFNRNSMLKSSDGKFYFGSIDGLYSFFPEQLNFVDDIAVPKPFLGSVTIYNKNESTPRIIGRALRSQNEISMNASDTDVILALGAPSYENEIYYKYRIPGIREEWSRYSTNNRMEFVSFPSGNHQVQVRTYIRPESENYSELIIKIHKPLIWFKRLWIQLLMLVGAIALIYFGIRSRFQAELERNQADAKLRTKLSSDLHDDVGSLLSGVALQSEVLSYESTGELKEGLLEISDLSRRAMEGMRDVVWAIDSRKDKYENLIDRMRSFAEKNLAKKDIQVSFEVIGIEKGTNIDPESRQNYYLILKEAVTNIVKHSNATEVKIIFSKDSNATVLSISDNGLPNKSYSSDGLGLSNMKLRAKALGGNISINHTNGFEVNLNIEK